MALVGCSQGDAQQEVRIAPKELPIATIIIKDYGTVEAELYPHIQNSTTYDLCLYKKYFLQMSDRYLPILQNFLKTDISNKEQKARSFQQYL